MGGGSRRLTLQGRRKACRVRLPVAAAGKPRMRAAGPEPRHHSQGSPQHAVSAAHFSPRPNPRQGASQTLQSGRRTLSRTRCWPCRAGSRRGCAQNPRGRRGQRCPMSCRIDRWPASSQRRECGCAAVCVVRVRIMERRASSCRSAKARKGAGAGAWRVITRSSPPRQPREHGRWRRASGTKGRTVSVSRPPRPSRNHAGDRANPAGPAPPISRRCGSRGSGRGVPRGFRRNQWGGRRACPDRCPDGTAAMAAIRARPIASDRQSRAPRARAS